MQYFFRLALVVQMAVLVPGSFGSNYNSQCDVACYDEMCALDARYKLETRRVKPLLIIPNVVILSSSFMVDDDQNTI